MNRLLYNVPMAVLSLLLFHSAAHAFTLPDTGQTKCYDVSGAVISCIDTGQDGDHILNPLSYTDNSDGTVTDNNTGLLWQKCSVGQNNDSTCSGAAAATYNWYQASGTYDVTDNASSQNVCGSLNLGGYTTGWRLPTKKELRSIVDYSIYMNGPMIQTTYFPNTIADNYWSSNTSPSRAGVVYFSNGADYNRSPSYNTYVYVRCVRGVQATQSLSDNHDFTVTDSSTGLMWQQAEPGGMTWSAALSYCNNLSLAGQTDWRLPNLKELEFLMDDTRSYEDIDRTFFPNFPIDGIHYYWTSTTESGIPTIAKNVWSVSSEYAGIVINGKSTLNSCNVRCVRGGQSGAAGNFVRLMHDGSPGNTYSTFHAAYAAAVTGDVIEAQAGVSSIEALTFASSSDIAISLIGGYDSGFASVTGFTTLSGSLTISRGSVIVTNLIIK
jgi:hypothetical protein